MHSSLCSKNVQQEEIRKPSSNDLLEDIQSDIDTDTKSEENDFEIGKDESKAVDRVRLVLMSVLLVVAAAISVAVFLYSRQQEINDFEEVFSVHANKIIDSVRTTTARSLRAIEGFALQITIHAIDHHLKWPNVALSDFESRARITIDLAEAISLIFIPIVTNTTRPGWEKFSVKNQDWLAEGLAIQELVERKDEQKSINQLVETYGHDPKMMIPNEIFKIEGEGITDETGPGPYAPWWQFAPAFPVSRMVNYNTLSTPSRHDEFMALMETEETIVGKAFDYTVASTAETSTRSAVLNLFLNRRRDNLGTYTGGPVSDLYTPIFNHFGDDHEMVGILTSYVYWEGYFEHVLPHNVNGLVAVLENSCDQIFSFQLNGAEAEYLGEGDLHDDRYDHLEVSTGFGGVFLQKETKRHEQKQCIANVRLFPSKIMENDYLTSTPLLFAVVLVCTFMFTSLVFIWYQRLVDRRQVVVMKAAVQSTAVVQSLFPANVRGRLFEENDMQQSSDFDVGNFLSSKRSGKNHHGGQMKNETDKLKTDKTGTVFTSETIFGSKPIADLFAHTTVMFADMVGFTAWSSVRDPTQVFMMLETIYHSFDIVAKKMRVFKVETVGDCYVAVAGLPTPREDHAVVMARFASLCLRKMAELSRALEMSLGPDTADLGLRIGLHSGPVTAGVLRGDKGRFQLFGDTVNTASRMESTGLRGKIHISRDTYDLLTAAGKCTWIVPREGKVVAKGKGELQTYWLRVEQETKGVDSDKTSSLGCAGDNVDKDSKTKAESCQQNPSSQEAPFLQGEASAKAKRLINWNVELLARLLKQILAARTASRLKMKKTNVAASCQLTVTGETVLDEVKDIIALSKFNELMVKKQKDPETIELSPEVTEQLSAFVTKVCSMYRQNQFHNFEHASHVTMSVTKLLNRIVNPLEVRTRENDNIASDLHDRTFGIASDPLAQFACIFSALIHDLDHPGVANSVLVQENQEIATKYKNKSVAEQNSVDLAWDLLMGAEYEDLRRCIYGDEEELQRFRQLVVNVVMATDIMDKDLGALRKARWDKAFTERAHETQEDVNRKATIVIEHLIQASDVAHTMQHWHVYQKWNERLFNEMYKAYLEGRTEKDPAQFWYKGEIGFFDFYIIPLAKKLETCGVFGVSSDEYLNYALANRWEWEQKGESIVNKYMEKNRSSVC